MHWSETIPDGSRTRLGHVRSKKMESIVLKGYQQYHNYFREHEELVGKTLAEVAGIGIEANYKWITIIQNASKFSN